MEKYTTREDVPEKYKWDLTDFFKNENEFNKSLKKSEQSVNSLKEYIGCSKNAKILYRYLNDYFESIRLWENIYIYAHLINDQDLGISENISRLNSTLNIAKDIDLNTAFFVPELLKLSKEEYDNLFKEEEKLCEYKEYLDEIFRDKEHTLTENEEKIVSELTSTMSNIEDISSTMLNSEHNYGTIKLDDGTTEVIAVNNFRKLTKNENIKIRKKVYNQFNKKLDEYSSTNASLLNNYINMNSSVARIRHFNSAWDKKLFSYNISNKVYESLVTTTENNLNILQKYYDLKKKVLGFDVLHKYDMNLDMCKSDKTYTIEEAQEILLKSISVLGNDYVEQFKNLFDKRYIDYCQYKGKISGAYSASSLDKPSRICMSFNGDLDSISTIAHEGGHHVHHNYVSKCNSLQYRSISLIQAEVASLTNECLLSDYILKNGISKEEKLSGLDNIMRVIIANLFGAVREGKMEQEMYNYVENGGMLTKDYLDNLSLKSLKKYYGKKVKFDKYVKNDWITISHYYADFYLYSYAISISVATNVASKILEGDKVMLENYHKFLCTGGDVWPTDAFKILGVDLESNVTYENAIKYFDSLIEKFKKLINDEEV